MNSNIQTSQNYSDLPTYQTGNTFVPNNNSNDQHASNNTVGTSNTTTLAIQNDTFEFYFPLSNDTRIYRVTYQYTELHPLDNARLLNNSINLFRITDHHHNIQSLIQQQIQQQQVQQPVYQQTNVQPDNSDAYNTVSNSVNETISESIQDTG